LHNLFSFPPHKSFNYLNQCSLVYTFFTVDFVRRVTFSNIQTHNRANDPVTCPDHSVYSALKTRLVFTLEDAYHDTW
jgi:hypothetical protein